MYISVCKVIYLEIAITLAEGGPSDHDVHMIGVLIRGLRPLATDCSSNVSGTCKIFRRLSTKLFNYAKSVASSPY